MLTFAVMPKTPLVTGFQLMVNPVEKPSSQSPTPINQRPSADTFTPSAVKSRVGNIELNWDSFCLLDVKETLVGLNLEEFLLLDADEMLKTAKRRFFDAIHELDTDLKERLLNGEGMKALIDWIEDRYPDSRDRMTQKQLDRIFTDYEPLIQKIEFDELNIRKTMSEKEYLLKLLKELKDMVDYVKSLTPEYNAPHKE
jgi:hypothetical protein